MPVIFNGNLSDAEFDVQALQKLEIMVVCDRCGAVVDCIKGEAFNALDAKGHIIHFHRTDRIYCVGGCKKEESK